MLVLILRRANARLKAPKLTLNDANRAASSDSRPGAARAISETIADDFGCAAMYPRAALESTAATVGAGAVIDWSAADR